ncbi:caspase family protein [Aequorivita sp. SDUM287046]|uniref:Caspase family protein n=1 Tax=Aequorivita aurantiaca TaxID=3053356 RepID=A0ABT8DFS6_9FLAO|nr:caspase family protein [Aequorivita aurantiaca]MDN3723479.1 caspase family protein [Aequorivita aurantiaca]
MAKLKNAHALLIGVGSEDLPETVTDAKALQQILGNKKYGSYYKKNVTLLTGKKATRLGILSAFDELLSRTDEKSSIFLYYSGHGGMYSDNTFIKDELQKKPEDQNQKYFHLCPNDYDPKNYENTWIKAEEIKSKINQMKSRRLIFFLDCCHAAGMTAGVTSLPSQPRHTNADGLAQKLDNGRGMTIVSACRAEQLSVILEGDQNSLFTKCMIEVLRGDAKINSDPFVRIFEVVQYIFKKVPEIYPDQNPYANLQIFEDFVVSFTSHSSEINTDEVEIETLAEPTEFTAKEPITKFRETEESNSVIIFVHGFSGIAEMTFFQATKLLIENSEMDGWDMFPLGYSGNIVPEMGKNIWACASDIKRNSDYLLTSIKNKFGHYKRIALIAHDLGGIVIQQTLLELDREDLDRISHILLFGTPSNGLPEIQLKNFFTYSNEEKELKEGSPYIQRLRSSWEAKFNNKYPFAFKTVAATRDDFVPISSSLGPFDKKHHEIIEGDHFSIVKIDDENDDGYRLLLNTLMNKGFLNKFSNKEEVNIALGEYNSVINALLPKLDTLDKKGLEQLVYALEGVSREEEAFQILNDHSEAKNNSNILGIMGGRYKRQYLKTFSAEDLRMARKHYSNALQIAEGRNDFSQIYYHAINLAFLSLMNENKIEMAEFAELAFTAAQRDPFPSLWKLATLGEAYLYKGNFENSKLNYKKAAQMAGLREKISIHSNAYNAYVSLMQTDNPNDLFIKFLKTNYLS